MHEAGATIFRINGSHVMPKEIANYTAEVRKALGHKVAVLVDLPGNKIRTAILPQPIPLKANDLFKLRGEHFNFPGFVRLLQKGDILLANDSMYKFRVESVSQEEATLLSYTDGLLVSNKGVHLTGRHTDMPLFFERDLQLIEESAKAGVDFLGVSFVRTGADVDTAQKSIQGTKLGLIIKVETRPALQNLDDILGKADVFLVDRGDLSCDVGIESVNEWQKWVLAKAKQRGKKIFFATQFLHSMLHNPVPLIAEACGVSEAITSGVNGIQLSEETAIGKYPVEVLNTVKRIRLALEKPLVP